LIANSNGIGCVAGITPPSLLLGVLQTGKRLASVQQAHWPR
jgi:hypothetical protein